MFNKLNFFINLILLNAYKYKTFWNGKINEKIPCSIIKDIQDVLKYVKKQPKVIISGRESFVLSWKNENFLLELEVFKNSNIACLYCKDRIIFEEPIKKEELKKFLEIQLESWFK